MILGGGLGAGMAAIMKQESQAAQLLGKIQAQGGQLSSVDEAILGQLLGEIYQKPSQMMYEPMSIRNLKSDFTSVITLHSSLPVTVLD